MIRIGIIDSGLDAITAIKGSIVSAISISVGMDGKVLVEEGDITDDWGHGTSCFSMIDAYGPGIEYVIVKIFSANNRCSNSTVLSKAIRYCVREGAILINMSLGVESHSMPDELVKACDDAYDSGVILVAAAHDDSKICYPAHYPKVIGVGCFYNEAAPVLYYTSSSYINFYTSGAANSLDGNQVHVSSFSCARVTGMIAGILIEKGKRSFLAVNDDLRKRALPFPNSLLPLYGDEQFVQPVHDIGSDRLAAIAGKHLLREQKFSGIGKVLIIALGTEENIFRKINPLLLENGFDVEGTGDMIDMEPLNTKWLRDGKDDTNFDTVALGNLKRHLRGPHREHLFATIIRLVQKDKGFIFFDRDSMEIVQQVKKRWPDNKSRFFFWELTDSVYKEMAAFRNLPSVTVPVLSVFGAGSSDTTHLQVLIKKVLERNHGKVSYIATNRHAELAEACFVYPYADNGIGRFAAREKILFLKHLLKGVQFFCNPEYILTGVKSAVLSVQGRPNLDWPEAATFLGGVQPDVLFIYTNHTSTDEDMERHVITGAAIANTRVVCLLVSPGKKINTKLTRRLKEKLDCKVIELGKRSTGKKISEAISSYFGKPIQSHIRQNILYE
jgi:hypothetical protein